MIGGRRRTDHAYQIVTLVMIAANLLFTCVASSIVMRFGKILDRLEEKDKCMPYGDNKMEHL